MKPGKTAFTILSCFSLLFSCSPKTSSLETSSSETEASSENQLPSSSSETSVSSAPLIVFFSRAGENYGVGTVTEGNTAVMADYLSADLSGSVSFEIVPADPYPASYQDTLTRVQKEKDENARPAIASSLSDWSSYDTVFLGFPIWYGTCPQIILTFLDEYPLESRNVYLFATSGGSSLSAAQSEISTYGKGVTVRSSLLIAGTAIREESAKSSVQSWLRQNGF
jgi:hypothetical protein